MNAARLTREQVARVELDVTALGVELGQPVDPGRVLAELSRRQGGVPVVIREFDRRPGLPTAFLVRSRTPASVTIAVDRALGPAHRGIAWIHEGAHLFYDDPAAPLDEELEVPWELFPDLDPALARLWHTRRSVERHGDSLIERRAELMAITALRRSLASPARILPGLAAPSRVARR
jgi:hypothetical protein